MNLPISSAIPAYEPGRRIHFEDFEISWAGENPLNGEIYLGSYDGRCKSFDRPASSAPLSPSGEAVNGMAFSALPETAVAVSTRSDVTFLVPDGRGDWHRADYDGGAHGVIATSSGGFIAPLGRNGLLTMKPVRGAGQILGRFQIDVAGNTINFYKLARCSGDGTKDLIVAAARKDGFAIIEVNASEDRIELGLSHFLRNPGLDIVDICSLASPDWPRAVAWLGVDRSIHLSRDILQARPFKSLQIDGLRGKAYTVLHDRGHLFLLTSEAVYGFPDLASRFLSGEMRGDSLTVYSHYSKEYDDIYLHQNHLFLGKHGDIYRVPSESFPIGRDPESWQENSEPKSEFVEVPWERSSKQEWSNDLLITPAA